jgi:hypothetical protein
MEGGDLMSEQKTCKQRVREHLSSRISDLEKLWKAYKEDPDKPVEDLGTFDEYGLSFDYVKPGTFERQRRGYFRYQLSYGGPSDEFRFYCDENLNPVEIEYWFLDWFDGAHIDLTGENYNLMEEIFLDLKETSTVQHKLDASREE